MKRGYVVLLFFAVVSLAVFGSFAMDHGTRGCLASAARGGAACPPGNALAIASFFLEALKGFSTANLEVVGIAALFLLLSLWWFPKKFLERVASEVVPLSVARTTIGFLPSFVSLVHWLTLHERRDPAVAA